MTQMRRTGPVLTTTQAAEYCGIAKQTMRNLLAAGEGPKHFKHGRLNAFFSDDLDEWLASRLTEQNPAFTPHNR